MQLLGSIIYITSTFYRLGDWLVHWTHSFLYLHNTAAARIFQDGMFHKKCRKKLEKVCIDTGYLCMI